MGQGQSAPGGGPPGAPGGEKKDGVSRARCVCVCLWAVCQAWPAGLVPGMAGRVRPRGARTSTPRQPDTAACITDTNRSNRMRRRDSFQQQAHSS
jgi:hypothetical protein